MPEPFFEERREEMRDLRQEVKDIHKDLRLLAGHVHQIIGERTFSTRLVVALLVVVSSLVGFLSYNTITNSEAIRSIRRDLVSHQQFDHNGRLLPTESEVPLRQPERRPWEMRPR